MCLVDALVAEVLAYFKHFRKATNDEFLEVELGCDSHEEVHFVIVMERLEWFLL